MPNIICLFALGNKIQRLNIKRFAYCRENNTGKEKNIGIKILGARKRKMNKNKFNAKQKVGKNTNRCLAKQKECNCSCTEMEKKNKVVEKTWTERLKTNVSAVEIR